MSAGLGEAGGEGRPLLPADGRLPAVAPLPAGTTTATVVTVAASAGAAAVAAAAAAAAAAAVAVVAAATTTAVVVRAVPIAIAVATAGVATAVAMQAFCLEWRGLRAVEGGGGGGGTEAQPAGAEGNEKKRYIGPERLQEFSLRRLRTQNRIRTSMAPLVPPSGTPMESPPAPHKGGMFRVPNLGRSPVPKSGPFREPVLPGPHDRQLKQPVALPRESGVRKVVVVD